MSSLRVRSNMAVPLRGAAIRAARLRCEGSSAPAIQPAAEAAGAPCAVPPAAAASAQMRGPPRSTFRAATASRSGSAAADAAPVNLLRERLRNPGSRARAVLRRAGRGTFDEGNAAACGPAFQSVEGLPPGLRGDGPVRTMRVGALADQVGTLQRLIGDEIVALHDWLGEAMEFPPSRLRLRFLCPRKRRLLPAAALRACLPRDTARGFGRIALRTAGVRRRSTGPPSAGGGEAPDARIRRALRRAHPDGRQKRFEQEWSLGPPAPRTRRGSPEAGSAAARAAGSRTPCAAGASCATRPGGPAARIPGPERTSGRLGVMARNERYRLHAQKRGNPGSLPGFTRGRNPCIARCRRTCAERATRTGIPCHPESCFRIALGEPNRSCGEIALPDMCAVRLRSSSAALGVMAGSLSNRRWPGGERLAACREVCTAMPNSFPTARPNRVRGRDPLRAASGVSGTAKGSSAENV